LKKKKKKQTKRKASAKLAPIIVEDAPPPPPKKEAEHGHEIVYTALVEANGWRAIYVIEEPVSKEKILEEVPIVCWALVESCCSDEQQMIGLVPDGTNVVPCISPTFLGYLAAGVNIQTMIPALNDWKTWQAEETNREQLKDWIRGEQAKSRWN
jgi:hypothetical protein